jgi:F0F1-type ATP synthase membrane subunit c/vacuolar-type H+-ATPase subunit K
MEIGAAKMIGAGIATFALLGVGLALGNIFSTLISSIARNPSAKNDLFPIGLLGFALTESIALLAFIVAMLILFSK